MITLHLSVWWIPTAITLLLFGCVALMAFHERNDTGLLSGCGTALVGMLALFGSSLIWVVFALAR